jgi:hypothetical protein
MQQPYRRDVDALIAAVAVKRATLRAALVEVVGRAESGGAPARTRRAVVVQVEIETQFESRRSLHRFQGLKPGAFKPWVNWIQLVQPHRALFPTAVMHPRHTGPQFFFETGEIML